MAPANKPAVDPGLSAEIDRLREKLLDVSNRNPLLHYRKSKRRTVEIIDAPLDQIFTRLILESKHFRLKGVEEEVDEIIATMLTPSNGSSLVAPQQSAPQHSPEPTRAVAASNSSSRRPSDVLQTTLPESRFEAVLNYIRREAATAIEETGVNYLFLSLGMLVWREADDSERSLMAPLILIPIEIDRSFDGRSNRYEHTLRWREEELQANLSLAKRLEKDFGIRLPDYEDEQFPSQYFAEVREKVCSQRDWEVREEATVGFFSFQKLLMYLDIDPQSWGGAGRLGADSILAQVIWGTNSPGSDRLYATDYQIDQEPGADEIDLAMDADSSQHSALMDIAAGKNLVIEGPPGTGKSQTITNAIAAAMSSGKTVLFVAEKLAALEVVHAKLKELGLGEFCLALHSDAASPRHVFDSLRDRLEARFREPQRLEELKDDLEQRKQSIADYLAASSRIVGPYQEPLYDLLWRIIDLRAQGDTALRSAKCDHCLTRPAFEENVRLLEAFSETLLELDQPRKSAWWGHWPQQVSAADLSVIIDRVSMLRNLALEAASVTQALEAHFGAAAADWIERCSGHSAFHVRVASLGANSVSVDDSDQVIQLLPEEARRLASQLCELLDRTRPLVANVSPLLRGDLTESADASRRLQPLLERHLTPAASFATWNELKDVLPLLSELLTAMKSPALRGGAEATASGGRQTKGADGAVLLAGVRLLSPLASQLREVIGEVDRAYGSAGVQWIESRAHDTSLVDSLQRLAQRAAEFSESDVGFLLNAETRKQGFAFCELLAEYQQLTATNDKFVNTDLDASSTSARRIEAVLDSPFMQTAGHVKWSEVRRIAALLPPLLDLIATSGNFGASLLQISSPQPDETAKKSFTWNSLAADLAVLSDLSERVAALHQQVVQTWGHDAVAWLAGAIRENGLLARVERLKVLVPRSASAFESARLLDDHIRRKGYDLCTLITQVRATRPFELTSPIAPETLPNRAHDLETLIADSLAPVLPGKTWGEARGLQRVLESLVDAAAATSAVGRQMESQGLGTVRALRDYERAEFLCKLARHPIVADCSEAPAPLFYRSAPAVLAQGRDEAHRLIQRRDDLAKSFHLASVPSPPDVNDTAKSLRRHVSSWLRKLNRDYRRATAALAEYCRPTVTCTVGEWIERLEELYDWQRDCEAFAANEKYAAACGELFQGVDTDWERCTTLLQWAVTAQTRGLDHASARRILQLRDAEQLTSRQVVSTRKRLAGSLANRDVMTAIGFNGGDNAAKLPLAEIERRASQLLDALRNAGRLAEVFSINDDDLLVETAVRCQSTALAATLNLRVNDAVAWSELGDWYAGDRTDVQALTGMLGWADQLSQLSLPSSTQKALLSGDMSVNCDSLVQLIRDAQELEARSRSESGQLARTANWASQQSQPWQDACEAADALALSGSESVSEIVQLCRTIYRSVEVKSQLDDSSRWHAIGDRYACGQGKASDLLNDMRWGEDLTRLKLPTEALCAVLQGSIGENLVRLAAFAAELQRIAGEWRQTPGVEAVQDWIARIHVPLEEMMTLGGKFQFQGSERPPELEAFCKRVQQAASLASQVSDQQTWKALGRWYAGLETHSPSLMATVRWTEQLVELQIPESVVKRLLSDLSAHLPLFVDRVGAVERIKDEWAATIQELRTLISADDEKLTWRLTTEQQSQNSATLTALIESADDLPAWITFCRSRDFCIRRGLADFTSAVIEGDLEADKAAACYRFTILERTAEAELRGSAAMAMFTRKAIEKARESYQQLDRELLKVTRRLVAHRTSVRRAPEGNARGRVGDFTELGLIHHEVQKQRRHCRIRDLLHRAGDAVQKLKPCFMMSPLSVAQFLDPNGLPFDIVLMDEASQIKPEDAIGTLLRAKQLVVVGDPKQLPPTSFFDRVEDELSDPEATQFDNTESILEVAMKCFQPVRRLRWHYRSQHESLIHFSNERFYDGDLVVFPSATGDANNLGVRRHYVEGGKFEGGCNLPEAERVAQAIIDHAIQNPHETLGVGTFNLRQSVVIQDMLDRLCANNAQAREAVEQLEQHLTEPLFINNLETLQGHERDVILISYTYGPDPVSGRVMNRFGPVTGPAGWRRINVLVTRARRRVEVFASMNPTDILGGPAKSVGVNAFKDYLEYSENGAVPDRGLTSKRGPESPFEESLARVIRRMGLDAVPQVGVAGYFIDIGVRFPDCSDFLLGVECDGATYHSAKSARDRDRLREEVIRSRGWDLHRVWSTDWYFNQKHEEERLRKAIMSRIECDLKIPIPPGDA